MLIVYDSFTGNTKRFVQKLGFDNVRIEDGLIIEQPFILVTYTIKFGEVPKKTQDFLTRNSNYMIAVASTGNRNWGDNFAKSADIISNMYNVPIICKIELSGTESDVLNFKKEVLKFEMD